MADNFILVDRKTKYLFPSSIQESLPDDHLARFVVEIVDELDLHSILHSYGGQGKAAYYLSVLVSLLFYGYATGAFSNCKFERACRESIPFIYISANTRPDHDTIATFRKRFLNELEKFFVQILRIGYGMAWERSRWARSAWMAPSGQSGGIKLRAG